MNIEMKYQYFWKRANLKYNEVEDKLDKANTFKECLKLVNDFMEQDYLINSYIAELTVNKIEELDIRECEKQYLLNKIEWFRYGYLKDIGKGKYNIFKLPKSLWEYQHIKFYNYGVPEEKRREDLIRLFLKLIKT
ncbi:hypothetical protein [Clostridium perfringens]|uniref:hypothetical protein n=1 Tax=Clostridium perfringens TaxID=1502 RepID=UPI0024BD47DD|nr:hypothetical protein [Clostridium perfringens]